MVSRPIVMIMVSFGCYAGKIHHDHGITADARSNSGPWLSARDRERGWTGASNDGLADAIP